MPSHHGPSTTRIAATTSVTPASGRSSAACAWPTSSRARPPASSTNAIETRMTVMPRVVSPVKPSSGSTRLRSVACSAGDAFLMSTTMPATLMTSGHASEPIQPAPAKDTTTRTATRSAPRPAASATPCLSFSALDPMVVGSSIAGTSSHATTYAATPNPPSRAAMMNASRTYWTSTFVRAAMPDATPPTRRCSTSRCHGPWPLSQCSSALTIP